MVLVHKWIIPFPINLKKVVARAATIKRVEWWPSRPLFVVRNSREPPWSSTLFGCTAASTLRLLYCLPPSSHWYGSWPCGPPEQVAERIADIQDTLPRLERVFVHAGGLGIPPRVMREDLACFAAEVMPAFRPKATAAGTR